MKLKVTCSCGSVFEAPEHLAGQVVRCPSCRQPLTIPGAQGAPPQGDTADIHAEPDLSDLSALDQTSLDNASAEGSTVGQSAIRRAPGKRKKGTDFDEPVHDKAISQEVDDRMTRLYEVYAGKEMRIKTGGGSKLKLLIALSIALATIGLGVGVMWHVFNTEYGGMESVSEMMAGDSAQDAASQEPVIEARKQAADSIVAWKPSDPARASGVKLSGVTVTTEKAEQARTNFNVQVVPASKASDRRLNMSTSAVLYRSLEPEGPFTQVDRVKVESFDRATGTLSFVLFDEVPDVLLANVLYYRVSGFDSDSKRLFDTPVGGFAHVPAASVSQGQVRWTLRSATGPVPMMRLQARLDAPGWDNVLLWRHDAQGSVQESLPDLPKNLPVIIESAVFSPTEIQLDSRGMGQWRMAWEHEVLNRAQASSDSVVGAAPYALTRGLDYRLTPDESSFSAVSRTTGDTGPMGRSRGLTFRPPGLTPQILSVAPPPGLTDVTVTAYAGRVRLTWDNSGLVSGLDRYDGTVHIAIHRTNAQGDTILAGLLPADSTGFTDKDLKDGGAVSYKLTLVHSGATIADAMIRVDGWIKGHGKLPVLVSCPNPRSTAPVVPGPELDRLYVSLAIPELSYDGTGIPALKLNEQLEASLAQKPGVAVVNRAALRCFVGADTGVVLFGQMPGLAGSPAQVQLRIVDTTGAYGDGLALWATDLATGKTQLLAHASVTDAQHDPDQYTDALQAYIASRLPETLTEAAAGADLPGRLIVGPIYPVDQPGLYYQAQALAQQLADTGDKAHPDLSVVSRQFWLDETGQDSRAIDHMSMEGAVLIVGRAWLGEEGLPGLSVQAVDAVGGRLIDRFSTESLTPKALREFAVWCGTLRMPVGVVPTVQSALLITESNLEPIHPIWRAEMAKIDDDASATLTFPGTGLSGTDGGPVLSFGLPLPQALGGEQTLMEREQDHPLYALRPYVAPEHPLTFEQWVSAYANYIEADCSSFIAGFERAGRLVQGSTGPVKPQLIIRGERQFTGDFMLPPTASGMRVSPAALSLREFFPAGAGGQPLVKYRPSLSEMFRARPWAMANAWRKVTPRVADPFLKSELYGVEGERYARLVYPEKPTKFYRYIAADLLSRIGRGDGQNYRSKALAQATRAFNELVQGNPSISGDEKEWATDALLLMIYERDPGAIQKMSDSQFRARYFEVDPDMQTDVLRMLVDRIGPTAWQWAGEFDSIDWQAFCWHSTGEMDTVTQSLATIIPEASRTKLRAWLEVPAGYAVGGQPDVNPAIETPNNRRRN